MSLNRCSEHVFCFSLAFHVSKIWLLGCESLIVLLSLPLFHPSFHLLEVFGGEHKVDEEVLTTFRRVEFGLVKFIFHQMDLVELLVLGDEFLLLGTDNLAFFSQLVAHEVLQLLPEVDLLCWAEVNFVITLLAPVVIRIRKLVRSFTIIQTWLSLWILELVLLAGWILRLVIHLVQIVVEVFSCGFHLLELVLHAVMNLNSFPFKFRLDLILVFDPVGVL